LMAASDKDDSGNAVGAGAMAMDCRNMLIRTSGPKIAAIGVEGLVVVATSEAVLVIRAEDAQRVREAADWFDREK
jgi:mannose-1-phosphate guanylyltransferase/mannose-6-phosphate isomerase